MLRLLVIALLLANLGWLAWARGWLPPGWLPAPGDAAQREPQRLARQVRPEAIELRRVGTNATPSIPEVPPDATACLQLGPLRADVWSAAVAAVEDAGVAPTALQRVPVVNDPGADWLRVPEADPETVQRLQSRLFDGLSFGSCP